MDAEHTRDTILKFYTDNRVYLFHCFIHVGVSTGTRKYDDITCRSWA